MEKLKDEFVFNYDKKEIKVKKLGEVHCAIFGTIAKPLIIEFKKDGEIHNGKISTIEGKFLSWLPSEAIEEIDPIKALQSIQNLLKTYNL